MTSNCLHIFIAYNRTMPIHEINENGKTRYRWGDHGTVYDTRAEAEEQEKAAYANGYTEDSARSQDFNGFIEIKDNPISMVGVFDYLGSEIGAPEPEKIYKVYRPVEELSRKETMDSFRGKPFTVNHAMLGDKGLPVDKKVSDGTIGDNVYFKDGKLLGNLHIWTNKLKDLISSKNKVELSAGYYSRYDFTPGVFNGQHYDAVQRYISGNHLAALPGKGRCGESVAVLDEKPIPRQILNFTYQEVQDMALTADEIIALVTGAVNAAVAPLKATMDEIAKEVDELKEDEEAHKKKGEAEKKEKSVMDEAEKEKKKEEEEEKKKEEEEEKKKEEEEEKKATEDAKMLALKIQAVQDETVKRVTEEIKLKDELVKLASPLVGTFDHAAMTSADVAKYAADKLGLTGDAETALRTVAKFGKHAQMATQDSKAPSKNNLNVGDFA